MITLKDMRVVALSSNGAPAIAVIPDANAALSGQSFAPGREAVTVYFEESSLQEDPMASSEGSDETVSQGKGPQLVSG